MKKQVRILGLMVLTIMLFFAPGKLSEQTPEKPENKQYAAAPMASSRIAETTTVSAATEAYSKNPATVEIIISAQTEGLTAATQDHLDAMDDSVEDDANRTP